MSALPSADENAQKPDGVRALKDLVRSELDRRRDNFEPRSFGIVVPKTELLPSGKFGQYRYFCRSGDIPNSHGWFKGLLYLYRHGGYMRIRGADSSDLFIDVDPNSLQRAATPGPRETNESAK